MSSGRNKFLVLLVVILLLTNLGMLWYFTSNCEPKKEEEKLSKNEKQIAFITKELSLDSSQRDTYVALRARRDSAIRPLNDSLREAKLKFMSYVKDSTVSDSALSSAVAEVAKRQTPIEMEVFRHFQRVRNICNEQQKLKYDSMIVKFVNKSTGKDDKQ